MGPDASWRGQSTVIKSVMNSSTILAGGRAVDLVDALPVDAAEAEHARTGEALRAAHARKEQREKARAAVDRTLTLLRSERATAIAAGVTKQLRLADGSCPPSSTLLRDEVKRLVEVDALTAIAGQTNIELIAEILPESELAVLSAEIAHQEASAQVVESRRWARLREFNAALAPLAESEGAVELRSERFDRDGVIRNEFRMKAADLRRQLELRREHFEKLRTALKG
jgi:hypothetical protein